MAVECEILMLVENKILKYYYFLSQSRDKRHKGVT